MSPRFAPTSLEFTLLPKKAQQQRLTNHGAAGLERSHREWMFIASCWPRFLPGLTRGYAL